MGRITILTQFFPPETNAAANRLGVMADTLATRHELRVVTLQPSYPSPESYTGESVEIDDRSRLYPIDRGFAFRPHYPSLAIRALLEIGMSLRLARRAISSRPNAIVTSSPSMFLGPAAWLLARAVGAKFIWDVRDLTWRYASESIQLSNLEKRAARTLEQWMNFVASQADLVIVATNGIAELLVETGIRQSRILTVPNGVSKAVLEQFVEEASPRKARPLVAYIGLLGYNQAVGVLLDVAKRVPEADFLIVGDGPERIALLKRAKHDNVSNLELHPYVTDRDEIISLYRKADVLVHHTLDTPTLNRTSNPSKLYEYMAARRPIVYGGKGLAADVISASGGGLVVPPQDPDSMALAIRSLLEDPKGRLKMARDGRSFVERHHCRETLMECILEAVGRVLRETV